MGPWEAEENGEWLCPGSPYRDIIKSRIPQDPRLRQRCPKAVAQGTLWPPQKTRIVNLKLGADNLFQKTAEWTDVGKFQHHLELKAVSTTPRNDIILVEGLCPDLIDILGTEFDIDPSFFVNHERVGVFSQDPDGTTELPCLPSTINWSANSKGVTFKYYEPLSLSGLPPGFHLSCAHSGRHVGVFRLWGRISRGVVARRKCSIWQVSKACGGYTCIVLCDPPVTVLQTKDKTDTYGREPFRWPLSTAPYKGGYPDFMMGQSGFKGVSKGPPRSSMLDDLCYYLTAYDLNLLDLNNDKCPPALGVFAEKIIASHYASLTLFMSTVLSIQQSALSRQDNMSLFSLSTVEQQWSDIQAWERRLNEYCTDIEDLMLKLSVPFQDPDPSQIQASTWYSSTTDFQFLRMRLQQLRNRAEQVNAATSGLASIAGNRQAHQEQQLSSREALRTKALTLVGLVFIPLAYTATLFSMDDQYMPGAKHFWIYFCVAVPLIFTVLGAYWLLDKVYGNEGSSVLDFSRFKNTPWKKYVFMDRKQHFDASSC